MNRERGDLMITETDGIQGDISEQAATQSAAADPEPRDPRERAQALRVAREYGAADAELSPLVNEQDPREEVLVEYALVANDQRDWPTAVQRWRAVMDRFPQQLLAHASLVNALTASLRFDEAEAQAAQLLRRFPGDAQARWAAAWCAHERADWDLAANRWKAVLEVDQGDIPAVCCHITALTNDGRYEEATVAADSALERFGENAQLAETCAWIPHKNGDWPLAVERWQRVTELDPSHGAAFACLATAMRALNRHELAEQAILRAIEIAPDEFSYRADYALGAEQRGDVAESKRRWEALRERYAGDPDVLGQIGHHEMRAGLAIMETAVSAPVGTSNDTGERSLMMSIESLGDNCEFGMLQRRFGAEPLGLLRFAGISLPNLIEAMSSGFERVGNQEGMLIEILSSGEYLVHDAYGIEQHTFVYRHEISQDRFAVQTARRSAFLRNKLLEDLRDGSKLFVYRIDAITQAQALEVHAAMRTYGRPNLLCVQKADAYHPAGTVETVQEGLMLGYVSRFAVQEGLQDCEYGDWLAVCRRAAALRSNWLHAAIQG